MNYYKEIAKHKYKYQYLQQYLQQPKRTIITRNNNNINNTGTTIRNILMRNITTTTINNNNRNSIFFPLQQIQYIKPNFQGLQQIQIRHATKKAGGSTKNGRDSPGQRLGVKIFGGQLCAKSNIIIRQRGSTWHAGENVGTGRDYTLYAKIDGVVHFHRDYLRKRKYVSVKPFDQQQELL